MRNKELDNELAQMKSKLSKSPQAEFEVSI